MRRPTSGSARRLGLAILLGTTALLGSDAYGQGAGSEIASNDVVALFEARDRFLGLLDELETTGDRFGHDTTTGDRLRRDLADAALAFASRSRRALDSGMVPEADRETALDDVLTAEQIAGAVLVEVGECRRGVETLDRLLADPGLDERPLVAEAAAARRHEAHECIEQRARAAVAATRPARRRTLGWTLSGVALGTVGVAAGLTARSTRVERSARNKRSDPAGSLAAYESDRRVAERSANGATASWIVAGSAAAAGVVLLLAPSARSGARLTLRPHPVGASLTCRW